jgi:opacity protein-like surface antigen
MRRLLAAIAVAAVLMSPAVAGAQTATDFPDSKREGLTLRAE